LIKQLELVKQEFLNASNRLELGKTALYLTNEFLNAEVQRLRAQIAATAGEEKRTKETTHIETIKSALKSLRKISTATDVGVNSRDYSQMLIESNAAVQDAINATKGELSSALAAAYGVFSDANTLWQEFLDPLIPSKYGMSLISSDTGQELCRKYGLGRRITLDDISKVTGQAKTYIKQAEDAFAKEASDPGR
jgi:hypothetical protein